MLSPLLDVSSDIFAREFTARATEMGTIVRVHNECDNSSSACTERLSRTFAWRGDLFDYVGSHELAGENCEISECVDY